MKLKSIVFTAILTVLQLSSSLCALPTTEQEAEMVVTGWLKADSQPLGMALGQQIMRVETFTDDYGEPVYYIVYLQPSGFVIVSADDLVEPIISFVNGSAYEPSLENPLGALVTKDLNGRIASVRGTVSLMAKSPQAAATETQKKWNYFISLAETSNEGLELMGTDPLCDEDRPGNVWVAPLVQSKWGQTTNHCYEMIYLPWPWYVWVRIDRSDACFNYYTPQLLDNRIFFVEANYNNYPCGCLATVMAQLMRYHKYPNEPVEPNKFIISVEGQMTERWLLGGEGPNGAYNWDDMVMETECSVTEEQRRAIGALCHDAGVSANMQYFKGGSGTFMHTASNALKSTFKYDNAIVGHDPNINDDSWSDELIDMINPNLDAACPVILAIGEVWDPNRGHAVICDGYGYDSLKQTMYHHLNMGWYGVDDCWYNLPAVDAANAGLTSVVVECIYNIFTDGTGEIISGRITDAKGRAIEDAAVTAQSRNGSAPYTAVTAQSRNGSARYTAVTNRKGIYVLKGLDPNSTYSITVNKIGYDFELNEVDTGTSSDGGFVSGNKWGVNFEGIGNCVTVTIGTETSDWDYPMHTGYHDSRTQVIYLASEIGSSGLIMALSLDVTKAPEEPMENWTIRMKHTSMSEYDSCSLDANDWTVVYQNNEEFSGTGWQKFELQTPFEYNGTDNLLVDFSHNNSSYTDNGECRASGPGGNRSVYAYSDSGDGDPLDWSMASSPKMRCSGNIPNVKLTIGRESQVISKESPEIGGYIKLSASDGKQDDHFGHSVSINGDYAIVGAYGDDNYQGSAYIFKREGASWMQQAKLTPLRRDPQEYFGYSVSISGDYVIVGAPKNDDTKRDSGVAYIFKREGTSWMQQSKLYGQAYSDNFGDSVSISGDYVIVGAPENSEKGAGSGSAFIFKRNGTSWTQQTKLTASDGAPYNLFGYLVSINGDYAIVAAERGHKFGEPTGSAYIFKREGTSWTEQTKLIPLDGSMIDLFGRSVSISGDYAVVGANSDNDNGDDSGSAYIFKRESTSWTQQAKLTASDGAPFDLFGNSVSIIEDYIIVGAAEDDDDNMGRNCGSAYIFKREGASWTQEAKLIALDGAYNDFFGSSVSISGDCVIVGAPNDDDKGTNSGSAYIFERDGSDWTE